VFNLKVIDLTQEIYNGMPVFPGHLKTVVFPFHTHEETMGTVHGTKGDFSYTTFGLLMCDHGPTHVDSIWHISNKPGAKKIDEIAVENFVTGAVCLDFTHIKPKGIISVKDLETALAKAKHDVRKGDTVLIYTGHYEKTYPKKEYLTENAGLDYDGTAWLAKLGVVNIGIDASTIDSCGNTASKFFPAHEVCAEYGVMNTENLCNLGKVAGKRFTYVGLPLKIRGGTGSHIRAVAILEE
jgi:kynurenine formamidase